MNLNHENSKGISYMNLHFLLTKYHLPLFNDSEVYGKLESVEQQMKLGAQFDALLKELEHLCIKLRQPAVQLNKLKRRATQYSILLGFR